jgi:hypothetical protein
MPLVPGGNLVRAPMAGNRHVPRLTVPSHALFRRFRPCSGSVRYS